VQKSFVVFAQNNTDVQRRYRFTIQSQPPGGQASFLQFSPAGSPLLSVDATLAPRSQAARTVYATSSDPTARIVVSVVEVVVPPSPTPLPPIMPGGLTGTIVLNPDVTNPDVTNPDVTNLEVLNPDVTNPDVTNPDVTNPDVTNPDVTNPDVTNIVVSNPDVTNPAVANPDVTNPDVTNPDVTNPDVTNPDVTNGAYIDVTWTVTNGGNTAASFSVKTLLSRHAPPGFKLQLLLHKVYTTPVAAEDCTLKTETHTVLLANIVNPAVTTNDVSNARTSSGTRDPELPGLADGEAAPRQAPGDINPDVTNPDVTNATLWLEPGDSARITLRVLAPDRTQLVSKQVTLSDGRIVTVLVDPAFDPSEVAAPLVIAQAVDTADAQAGITTPNFSLPPFITTDTLPPGVLGQPYDQTLLATGGTGTLTWTHSSGSLPAGLTLTSAGRLHGVPTLAGTSTFTVRVTDQGGRSASATFSVLVTTGGGATLALTPVVTDQTPLALSNNFGPPSGGLINQAGDYAFWQVVSAMFYRRAGASAPMLVFQSGDELPGHPGVIAHDFLGSAPRLNATGVLAFGSIDVHALDEETQSALLTFDGTTLRTIATGLEAAPGTAGARYARSLALGGLNDSGDVLFTASPVPAGGGPALGTTIYLARAGASPIRVAGVGDAAPGTGGTFSVITGIDFNNAGDIEFSATISGGTGGFGLFVWSTAGVRKVVATGDVNPLGGIFAFTTAPAGFFNNVGQVAFASGGSLFIDTPATGLAAVVPAGSPAPGPPGATLSVPAIFAFNDIGHVVFGTVNFGGVLYRYAPGVPIDWVAVAGAPYGFPFNPEAMTSITMNNAGAVTLVGLFSDTAGIYRQTPGTALTVAVVNGQSTPLGGTYDLVSTNVRTLAGGDVYFAADVPNGTADYAEFRWSPGGTTTVLMSTSDVVPAASRVQLGERSFGFATAGDYAAFQAKRAGGRTSVAVHRFSTQSTTVVAADGQAVLGGRMRFLLNLSNIAVGAGGHVPLNPRIIGGPLHDTLTVVLASAGGLSKVAADGDLDTAGRVLVNPALGTPGSANAIVNASGQVVVTALLQSNGTRALFVGTGGGTPIKVAMVGDVVQPGITITSTLVNQVAIDPTGQVSFQATTTGGASALLVGAPGGPLAKVARVGEPSPGGGTFASFAWPSFNNNSAIAFVATVTGGPNGVFVGSPASAPVALALDGGAAPSGGTYSIPSARPDVLINDQGDVLFRSDLVASAADSGYFIRRGPTGSIQTLVREGDVAPGGMGSFGTMAPSLNNRPGEFGTLGPLGDVSFRATAADAGTLRPGVWHVRTDGTIAPIVVRGVPIPNLGTVVTQTQLIAGWINGGRFATWVRLIGGSIGTAVVVYGPQ
jgi:hypothetical protein